MFSLEKAIAAWRRTLEYNRAFLKEDRDELESHVRDYVERLQAEGYCEEEAWAQVMHRMGDYGAVESEYQKVYWSKQRDRDRLHKTILWGVIMFKNCVKVALRNLGRHKGYTAINIGGLALGIACCVLILLYVRDELTYDRYHDHVERIYRIGTEMQRAGHDPMLMAMTPITVGPVAEETYAGIEASTRFRQHRSHVARQTEGFYEDNFYYADAAVFDIFSWPLSQGNPQTALVQPQSVVLTEVMAEKYFGRANPMGEAILVGDSLFTVTGVMAPVPANSHLNIDFLASFSTLEGPFRHAHWPQFPWWSLDYPTYVLLAEGSDAQAIGAQLWFLADQHIADTQEQYGTLQRYFLQPLADIHLGSSHIGFEYAATGSRTTVYLFAGIAFLILIIACVNFMNLATARSMQRAREVGMRKALGANRRQLVWQFLGESFLVTLAALVIAIVGILLVLPAFNALAGKTIVIQLWDDAALWIGLVALTLVTALLAGSYPAFALSGFRPLDTLKGVLSSDAKGRRLRQGLVVFQFATSVILIVATLGVFEQMQYMLNRDLGFDDEQVVVVPLQSTPSVLDHYETVKQEFEALPTVLSAAVSSTVPGRTTSRIVYLPEGADESETQSIATLVTDFDFIETLGLKVVAGRAFSEAFATDPDEGFIVNEAAVRHHGWGTPEQAVGKALRWGWPGKPGHIVGVVADFNQSGLQQIVEPMVMHIQPSWFAYLSLKIQTEDMATTLSTLETTWRQWSPDRPFEYFFLDADYARQYEAEQQLARLFTTFATLAIVIACLGLFGLAAFMAERRTKEIGVRKVLGASASSIALLLSQDFLKLVGIAFLIAVPIAYAGLAQWLGTFAYATAIPWLVFLLAGGGALVAALLTVSYQALKAAFTDPAKALRYE